VICSGQRPKKSRYHKIDHLILHDNHFAHGFAFESRFDRASTPRAAVSKSASLIPIASSRAAANFTVKLNHGFKV
jgi:hypothetical protein